MTRYAPLPRHLPPANGGREVTADERRGMALDTINRLTEPPKG